MNNERLHKLVEAQARRSPDAAAVEFQKKRLTYRELDMRANRLANYLRSLGVGPDRIVGINLEKSIELIVAVLGVLKAGGAYLPIDPSYPAERRQFMLEDSGAGVIVFQGSSNRNAALPRGNPVYVDITSAGIDAQSAAPPSDTSIGSNLAYMIYTSGSTGRPKGVMVPHNAACNYVRWAVKTYGLDPACPSAVHTPLGFDLTVTSLFPPRAIGAMLAVIPDSAGVEGLVQAFGSTPSFRPLKITPAHLQVVNELLPMSDTRGRTDVIVIGGEALTAETLVRWRREAPGTRLINEYGPTETTVGCCVYEITKDFPNSGSVPIGRPIDGATIYVLNEKFEPLSPGLTGELYIGGIGVSRGYHGRPALTAERFLPDPFSSTLGSRMYRSGDLAEWRSEGLLAFRGRSDDQVKIRGFRIELGEIDAVLAQHPAVSNAATVAHTDRVGQTYLNAYVSSSENPAPTSAELRAFVEVRLPPYMVPTAVVLLDALPLTSNGKIDRRALSLRNSLTPERATPATDTRTPTETALAQIWSEVLGCRITSLQENFFNIGGNSIKVAQVIGRVRSSLGVSLRMSDLFSNPTFSALTHAIDNARDSESASNGDSIVVGHRPTPIPLSFAQERIWFVEQMFPSCRAYRFHATIHLHGRLNVKALERALNRVVRRHELLRSTFHHTDGQPTQIVHAPYPIELPISDFRHLSIVDAEAGLQECIGAELREDFDIGKLPLMRWRLVCLNNHTHCLVHSEHHIIHDGWSFNIFLRDLVAYYSELVAGGVPSLAPMPIQFADYSIWERSWAASAAAADDVAYWKLRLANLPPMLELPYDRPRPHLQTFVGGLLRVELPAVLVESVAKVARRFGVTVFMTLLAAFYTLLHRSTGETDIAVGTTVANRDRPEVEYLIGMIVNNLVLRADISDNPTFAELLGRVRRTALEAYEHQRLPFNAVVNTLRPSRDGRFNPLFQVMFSSHDGPPPPLAMPEIEIELKQAISNGSAKFDWQIIALPYPERTPGSKEHGMTLLWEYNSDLFDRKSIVLAAECFKAVLVEIVSDPTQKVAVTSLLGPAKQKLVVS